MRETTEDVPAPVPKKILKTRTSADDDEEAEKEEVKPVKKIVKKKVPANTTPCKKTKKTYSNPVKSTLNKNLDTFEKINDEMNDNASAIRQAAAANDT